MSNRAMPETLEFPYPAPPKPGEAIEVRPGRLVGAASAAVPARPRQRLSDRGRRGPRADRRGDRQPASRAAWEALLAGPLAGRRLTRIIATHFHPDHIGLAGWLCERFDLQLAMSQTEYLIALNIRLDPQALKSEPYRSFYRSHGLERGKHRDPARQRAAISAHGLPAAEDLPAPHRRRPADDRRPRASR